MAASLFLLFAAPALADTIHVPGDFPTIQEAINNAVDGDLVLVAPGTYLENLNYQGKDITLESEWGPEATVIDGGYVNPVLKFVSGETQDAVLDGFTVTHGYHDLGGGIYMNGASPWIQNCILRENECFIDGGAMYYLNGSPTVSNCLVIHNIAIVFDAAGIYCGENSSGVITSCTFFDNDAWPDGWGGAMTVVDSSTVISDCVFWSNDAMLGEDIFWYYDQPTIQYCDIEHISGIVGPGNISTYPLFIDVSKDDFHLYWTSPCLDTGLLAVPGRLEIDFEGDPRAAYVTIDMGADEFHPHLYCNGDSTPGGTIFVNLTGPPDTDPVGFWISAGLLDPPFQTKWGPWHLDFPIIAFVMLPPMPALGYQMLMGQIPNAPPGPYDLFLQGMMGDVLTNPSRLHVE
jgi:hypothetical protein